MINGGVKNGMANSTSKAKETGSGKASGQKQRLSLTDQATKMVRDRILDLTLEPSMTLDDRQMLERFQVGRTPMREALNRLIAEGLVVSKGQRGMQVAPLSIAAAVELLDAYVVSERVVASMLRFTDPGLVEDLRNIQSTYIDSLHPTELARVTEINAMLHNRLARATQNAYILDQAQKLHRLAQRLSYFIYRSEAVNDSLAATLFEKPKEDHEKIIRAIENHDRDSLVAELTDHAIFFRTRLARIINEDRCKDFDFTGLASEL